MLFLFLYVVVTTCFGLCYNVAHERPTCHPRCAVVGTCQPNGRCLCWWGMTGPNSVYVEGGELHNRIIADYCGEPCHFTPYFKNPLCTEMDRVLDGLSGHYRGSVDEIFNSGTNKMSILGPFVLCLLVVIGNFFIGN